MATNNDERLEPYDPPSWAAGLPIVPRWKVKVRLLEMYGVCYSPNYWNKTALYFTVDSYDI